MTERRREILSFIVRFESEFGRLPTGREIAASLDMKPDTVNQNLIVLRKLKYLRYTRDDRGRYVVSTYRLPGEAVTMLDERQAVSA